MAYVFYAAIQRALNDNKVAWSPPINSGLSDVKGDDPEGVVDPRLPVQPGNPVKKSKPSS